MIYKFQLFWHGDIVISVETNFDIIGDLIYALIEVGIRIGFWNCYNDSNNLQNTVSENIDQVIFGTDGLLIPKQWAAYFCKHGGINKHDFVEIQLLAYELRELYEQGKIKITINDETGQEYVPNWDILEDRDDRDVKQMIKYYKRKYPTKSDGCKLREKRVADGNIRICCVCGNKNILLFKPKEK